MSTTHTQTPTVTPAYTVTEDDAAYTIAVDLPGISRDAVELKVEKGVLRLSAERSDQLDEGARYLYRESEDRRYELRLKTGNQVDPQKTSAQLENGRLSIRLEKSEQAKPAQIAVQ